MLALYKNIKKRRLELKMSQDQLAAMTGYKDRSSITKIEKGEVDPNTIAAHFDGSEFTEDELDEIRQFAEFVKNKRK